MRFNNHDIFVLPKFRQNVKKSKVRSFFFRSGKNRPNIGHLKNTTFHSGTLFAVSRLLLGAE